MLTQCPHCGTGFEIEQAHPPPGGLQVQCIHCNGKFAATAALPEPQAPPQLLVRQVSGTLYNPGDLATLQRWIVERRVIRDDLLAKDGQAWQRLGNVPELAPFFRAAQPGSGEVLPQKAAASAAVGAMPTLIAGAPAPAQQPRRAVMPRLEPNEDTGEIRVAAGRRSTGRRRTASRATMDDVFGERSGPNSFSFASEFRDDDDTSFSRRRSRRARRLFGLLLVTAASLLVLYVLRPTVVSEVVAMLRRAPVSDLAVREVSEGYKHLNLDSMSAISAASAAFESASKVDGHYAEARAGVAEAQLALAESYYQAAQDLGANQNKRDRGKRNAQIEDQRQNGSHAAERAFTAAKDALTLSPQSAAANRAMAEYFRIQGADVSKIAPLLERARAADPDDGRVMAEGAALLADREPSTAVAQYLKALELDPHLNRARYRLARLYLRLNDKPHALEQVEVILKAAPTHELGQELLMQLQPSADAPSVPAPSSLALPPAPAPAAAPPAPAAALLPPVAKAPASPPPAAVEPPAAPVPPPAAAPAVDASVSPNATYDDLILHGQKLRADHQPAVAADVFRRAISKDASAPAGYVGLGWCQLDDHQLDAAGDSFGVALEKGPWLADAHFGAAEVFRAKGDRRAAIKHYRQVLIIQPDGVTANLARQMLEELSK